MVKKKHKIFIAGHKGMVGSAIVKYLKKNDKFDLILRSKNQLDLLNQSKVRDFFKNNKIDQIYLSAAKVGGIYANNTFPADFIYENSMIQNNVIHAAYENNIKKLLFLGSSCIYPKNSNQPISESDLLTGVLETTNESYAIAKIAGIKMCESYNRQYKQLDFRAIMPCNLYGPGDNYHVKNSHVVPALISRFHYAKVRKSKSVKVWGTGKVKRELLFVNDLARAAIHVMNMSKKKYRSLTSPFQSHINVGSGSEISIKDLANKIAFIVGYKGQILFDINYPDGVKRKLLNNSIISQSMWTPKISLDEGISITYKEFLKTLSLKS